MASTQDCSLGLVTEANYGVSPGPVTRFLEFVDEDLDFDPTRVQGKGLRVGGRLARSGRRVTPKAQGKGGFQVEATSKGLGLLLSYVMGNGSTQLVSGTTQQQLFTFADTLPSFSLQQGLPEAGGTVDAVTFLGCMVGSFELDFPNGDIVTTKTVLDIKDISTGPAYAPPSYATAPNLFHFAGGSVQSGALTAPTATALASGGTTVADIRGGSLVLANNLAGDRFNMGGSGRKSKPTVGLRGLTGKLDIEYDSTTFRDAFLADSPMSLILTWTAGPLSTGLETLQVVIPEIKWDDGLPKANGTDLIVQNMAWTGLDNLTAAQGLWIVTRTSDSAL